MEEGTTDLFGIPVPSTDKVFLSIIILHIGLGIVCVISGIAAMFTRKGQGRHSRAGHVYYVSMTALFVTVILTSVMRWPHNTHLLVVGTLAYVCTFLGRQVARRKGRAGRATTRCAWGSPMFCFLRAFMSTTERTFHSGTAFQRCSSGFFLLLWEYRSLFIICSGIR
jgi:hypothetical protein